MPAFSHSAWNGRDVLGAEAADGVAEGVVLGLVQGVTPCAATLAVVHMTGLGSPRPALPRRTMPALADTLDRRRPEHDANRGCACWRTSRSWPASTTPCWRGRQKYVARHHARGKLLPRERIELLLDRDAPFLELSPLAAYGTQLPAGRERRHRHRRRRGRRVHAHRERPDGARRRDQPGDGARRSAGRCRSRARTGCRSSTWWSPAAPTCRRRPRSSSPAARCSAT